MSPSVRRLAALLFVSGLCAVGYQTAWLRLLRLIFGASTAASAAVLAIFMGGLGIGGLLFGRRADATSNPLRLYARLEIAVALLAAASPTLVEMARAVYIAAGGTLQLGDFAGTLLRLGLAALVLGPATVLMGGTLPAAVRAAEDALDSGRRSLGFLYGANTLGAVTGALAITFLAIEILGTTRSIWVAALLNLLVGIVANAWSRSVSPRPAGDSEPRFRAAGVGAPERTAPVPLVLASAGIVGFVFFLMEIVWYRMLAPILGGSSYTLGLILAVALLGIGIGGLLYGLGSRHHRPTLNGFAFTCALEALALAVPYALGDRVAFLAATLQPLRAAGLSAAAGGWAAITSLVVLPAAVVAGYQFPLLVAVLGKGEHQVGREVGWTYAANTAGAILGAIAGGFGLLPLLGATGAWTAAVLALCLLALAAAWAGRPPGAWPAVAPFGLAALAALALTATGPTAVWRHGGIGVGRFPHSFADRNNLHRAFEEIRSAFVWELDGRESSIAVRNDDDYSFYVNGKSDGAALGDAPTQVMAGLIGALLHPAPRTALVIGLGTGESAGWLAAVPSIERVDVVELEPAMTRVAEACEPANRACLRNPRVRLHIADGREFLLTSRSSYDIIFSEPSNPYRAGISSLYSREFYQAVAARLRPDGLFLQWLQGYDVDSHVVRTAFATLRSVFPHVESWQTHGGDLLLVAARQPFEHDFDRVRGHVDEEPYRSALNSAWAVAGLDGFYAGFVADAQFSARIAPDNTLVSTDDRPLIEFGFIRGLGRGEMFRIDDLRAAAHGFDRPPGRGAPPDWRRVEELRLAREAAIGGIPSKPESPTTPLGKRTLARRAFAEGRTQQGAELWLQQEEPPDTRIDLTLVAGGLALAGDERAGAYIDRLALIAPTDAAALRAVWRANQGQFAAAATELQGFLSAMRRDPWALPQVVQLGVGLAPRLAKHDRRIGEELYRELSTPFALNLHNKLRLATRLDVARATDFDRLCAEALAAFEPHPWWTEAFLSRRVECYERTGHPLAGAARRDLEQYLADAPSRFLPPGPAAPTPQEGTS